MPAAFPRNSSPVPEVTRQHGVRSVSGLLSDLERRDARTLAAILSVDVVGNSRLMGEDKAGTGALPYTAS
jgi:hypothetical protein